LTLTVHLIKRLTSDRIIIKVAVVVAKRTTIIRDRKLIPTVHLVEAVVRIRTKEEVPEVAVVNAVAEETTGEATVTITKERR
jgi:hypothetical protein